MILERVPSRVMVRPHVVLIPAVLMMHRALVGGLAGEDARRSAGSGTCPQMTGAGQKSIGGLSTGGRPL